MKLFNTDPEILNHPELPEHFLTHFPFGLINRKFVLFKNGHKISTLLKLEQVKNKELLLSLKEWLETCKLPEDFGLTIVLYQRNVKDEPKEWLMALGCTKRTGVLKKSIYTDPEAKKDLNEMAHILNDKTNEIIQFLDERKLSSRSTWIDNRKEILLSMKKFWLKNFSQSFDDNKEVLTDIFSEEIMGFESRRWINCNGVFKTFYSLIERSKMNLTQLIEKNANTNLNVDNIAVYYLSLDESMFETKSEDYRIKKFIEKERKEHQKIKVKEEISFSVVLTVFTEQSELKHFATLKESKEFAKIEHQILHDLQETTECSWELIDLIWEPIFYQTLPGNFYSSYINRHPALNIYYEDKKK